MADSTKASADDFEGGSIPAPKNAYSELMKAKPRPQKGSPGKGSTKLHGGRDGLGLYLNDPSHALVVYETDFCVVINDAFPKARVHMLILPKNERKNLLRPQEAFDDAGFLALCRGEEKKVRALAASELQRQLGEYSALDRARIVAMNADELPNGDLPTGRDWDKEIMSGTHANPSMNHLHIHVLSRDMCNEPMRKYNHYQSFTTDFFIGLDQFPLEAEDHRRNYRSFQEGMVCWRCGKSFGNRMASLKRHLEEEFERWKRE